MKSIDELLQLDYPCTVRHEDGDVVVEVNDLPGCMVVASTVGEAFADLEEVKRGWMESRREAGLEIPEPQSHETRYSGKCLLRMPKYLHARLVSQAEAEGSSLNQYIVTLLADATASRQALINCRTEMMERRTTETCQFGILIGTTIMSVAMAQNIGKGMRVMSTAPLLPNQPAPAEDPFGGLFLKGFLPTTSQLSPIC